MEKKNQTSGSSAVFKAGAISLAFLIIGYQAATFIHKAAELRIEANRDHPDTVYVVDPALARRLLNSAADRAEHPEMAGPAPASEPEAVTVRKDAGHSPVVEEQRRKTRHVESFRFNPNTVSTDDLQRLGFSEKQAATIDSYRQKGGRFRRKEDFAKSYVVADSVYRRLEPFIYIPRLDINKADSAAFDSLPGIGAYFAAQMVKHREELGGYTDVEQLMDIRYFDREKLEAIQDLITCGDGVPG